MFGRGRPLIKEVRGMLVGGRKPEGGLGIAPVGLKAFVFFNSPESSLISLDDFRLFNNGIF